MRVKNGLFELWWKTIFGVIMCAVPAILCADAVTGFGPFTPTISDSWRIIFGILSLLWGTFDVALFVRWTS
jgi:hypothetical protein